jgi:hypothetical protein
MSRMTRDEWITAYASKLGIAPPDAATVDTLLALAGTAAHASERTAAPIACYLVGLSGVDPSDASRLADSIGPEPDVG